MLDKKLALLQVVAVVCVYLIAAWPLSSALQINLFVGNERATAELKGFSDMVDKQFTYVYDESNNIIKVKATLQAKSGYNIQKVYFYKCKDKQPFDCMNSMQPVISTTPSGGNMWFDAEYAWNDVKVGTKANFMYIVKLSSGGKTIWASSWDKVLESGQSFITENYNADVNLYLNSGVSTSEAKSYIESNSELPADWTDHIVFVKIGSTTTTALNSMAGSSSSIDPSGTTNPDFDTAIVTGNSLDTFDYDYTFVSAVAGEKVSNPLTLFVTGQEPGGGGGNQPVCGNGICETGENSVNCPQDCATQQSQPRLSIRNWAPQVSVCGSEDVITYDVYVENPGDIGYYSSYYYVINNQTSSPNGISCAIQHPNIYQYKCSIYVSKIPYCTPGITTIYQSFVYSSRTLTSSFPITFQSPPGRLDVMSVNPSPFDCGIDNEMTVRLAVTNPPGTNPTTQYSFDGGEYQSMTCRATSTNVYECKLTNKTICGQYQEQLSTTFKFKYGTSEIASDPVNLQVSFPPPAMGIDMVSPDTATSGQTTSMEVLLHVSSYSNFDYNTGGFKYKYLDKAYKTTSCTLEKDFGTVKYYKCTVDVEVPANIYGQRTLTFSLTGYISSQPKTITANKNFEIVSPPPEPYLRISASSLDCLKDAQLTIQAIVDNQPETTPTTQYDIGEGFKSLSCTKVQSNTYTCSIEKSIICNLYKETANVKVKFIYSSDEITAEQNVRVFLPTPNLQVYSVYPDSFEKGKVTDASVNLYIDYPGSVGQNPEFTYNYLDKLNQRMTCTLVQGKHGPTGTRDYYDCAASFDIPSSANLGNMIALFQIKASSLVTTYTLNIVQKSGANVWLEIYNEPPVAEIESGNSTNATLDVYIHNAEGLEHTVEILRNEWVTGGTCTESPSGSYQYKCSIIITASSSRTTGTYDIDFGLRVRKTGESPFTLTNKTSVSVVPKTPRMSITLTPETLYCTGGTQTNPAYVTARGDVSNLNLDGFVIHESNALLDQVPIPVSCRLESNSIICDMGTNSFLEHVCEEMEKSNIKQPKSRPLVVEVTVRKVDQIYVLSASKYIKVEPAPDKPYIQFETSGWQDSTNKIYDDMRCLQNETIRFSFLLKNADLVHEEGKWDQSRFTFSFAAYGNASGVLAAKREYSEGADISCKMPPQTWIENMHRTERYECYLSIRPSMFQRCDNGHGTITMIVSGSKARAEGEFGIGIWKGNRKDLYDLRMEVLSMIGSTTRCQINSPNGDCQLMQPRMNATVEIVNLQGENGVPSDLRVTRAYVYPMDAGVVENVLAGDANCHKKAGFEESQIYDCYFMFRPTMDLDIDESQLNSSEYTSFGPFALGSFNLSMKVVYLNNLISDEVSGSIGSTSVKAEKSTQLLSWQKQQEKAKQMWNQMMGWLEWFIRIGAFCQICGISKTLVDIPQGIFSGDSPFNKEEWSSPEKRKDSIKSLTDLIIFLMLSIFTLELMTGIDKERLQDAYTQGGIAGLIVCVLPAVIETIESLWVAKEEEKTELKETLKKDGGGYAVTEVVGEICIFMWTELGQILTLLEGMLQFWAMQQCMQRISDKIDSGSVQGGNTEIGGATASVDVVQEFMSCISNLKSAGKSINDGVSGIRDDAEKYWGSTAGSEAGDVRWVDTNVQTYTMTDPIKADGVYCGEVSVWLEGIEGLKETDVSDISPTITQLPPATDKPASKIELSVSDGKITSNKEIKLSDLYSKYIESGKVMQIVLSVKYAGKDVRYPERGKTIYYTPTCGAGVKAAKTDNQVKISYSSNAKASPSTVTLKSDPTDANIYYTTDGSKPQKIDAQKYDGKPITIDKKITIKALGIKEAMTDSEIFSMDFEPKMQKSPTPLFNPGAGEVAPNTKISIVCSDGGASYYTVNDGDPTDKSTKGTSYTITSDDATLKAVCITNGKTPSDVKTAQYRVKQTTPPSGGSGGTVDFSYASPSYECAVQFTASPSGMREYDWDFGDGTPGVVYNNFIVHTYNIESSEQCHPTVTLIIKNEVNNEIGSKSKEIDMTNCNPSRCA